MQIPRTKKIVQNHKKSYMKMKKNKKTLLDAFHF